jgi:hypothetical protein
MKRLDPSDYLRAPVMDVDPAAAREFDAMFDRALARGENSVISYTSDRPKHEFLTYLVERRGLLMHGSNRTALDVLKPRTQTNYLGRPVRAVFATADGLWPMFFAVLDREIYEGSLRNGCFWVTNSDGARQKCYHFSINAAMLEREPWNDGMIYLLSREGFQQERDPQGELLEEWVSEKPVRPLARLPVAPQDFPFLRQVQGHDEAALERLERAPGDLFTGFAHLTELDDGYAVSYTGDRAWDAMLMEFVRQQRQESPDLGYEIAFDSHEGPIWLRLRGPAGAKDAIRDKLHSFLDARNVPG